jgi:cyclopropane fatty-acyl-phospholipid synthase-like methyltransferase
MSLSSRNINNSFFSGIYKQVWRETIPSGLSEAEVDFIMEMAGLVKGDHVLDFMCGYGRHALELAKRGIQVTAIDNADEYITEIREQSNEAGLPVQAIHVDILQANLQDTFKAALCMGNSIAFFNKSDILSILSNVTSHLADGGTLVINSWTIAEIAIKYFKEKEWHYEGEFKCVVENKYLFNPPRIEFDQTVISPDGLIENIQGIDYIFTLDEMSEMFAASGLTLTGFFSTPRKRKFSLGDTHVYIVAKKTNSIM